MKVDLSPHSNPTFSKKVCIIGIGTATAAGCNAPMTAASVRANLSRFSETFMIDKGGEPMLVSIAQFIDHDLRGLDRLVALAAHAAKEAMIPMLLSGFSQDRVSAVPICLGLATPRPGLDSISKDFILSRLEAMTGISFSRTQGVVIPTGHASGLMGVEKAVQWISSGKEEFVLVGGVDSYYDPDILEWLDENKRLHSEENRDGFIPGEGAGFCLFASLNFAKRYGLRALAIVLSAVSGEEPNPFTSDGICIGEGLTRVFHQVLAVLKDGEEHADWTICDMNGESFRASEWMYSYLRSGFKHRDPLEIWHPADCYGDIGAASGLVLAGIAIAAWERNYARGSRSLIWTSSDGPERSAMLIENV